MMTTLRENIQYSLNVLKCKTENERDNQSALANAILDFWNLGHECRFTVHAYVFKDLDIVDLLEGWLSATDATPAAPSPENGSQSTDQPDPRQP